jgi:O-antigen ligase
VDLMLRDGFLALGLLFSTASQLRPGSLPVGAGEVFLVVWSILLTARQLVGDSVRLTPSLMILLTFWAAFICAECIGYMTSLVLDVPADPKWFLHDVLAYPLVALVSCLLATETAERMHRVAWMLAGTGSLALGIQLLAGLGALTIPAVEPWYWERFRGWSANPNQLALLCAFLSLTALHLVDTATSVWGRSAAIACSVLPVAVGRMTGSDTFTLMLLASGVLFTVFKLGIWMTLPGVRARRRVAFAMTLAVCGPLLALSAAPAAMSVSQPTDGLAKGLMKNDGKDAGDEADLRFALWTQAIQRGLDTGLLGLGPGPHLAIPMSLLKARATEANSPGNIEHPENNGLANFEAHNTILDLLVQGGIIADIAFVWLLYRAARQSLQAGRAGLATLLCCLFLFGMTNLIIRQPLFWFAIVSCLGARALSPAAPFVPRLAFNNQTVV